jgi:tripartite-type tricarboxylate transporter receptor subunit TctC
MRLFAAILALGVAFAAPAQASFPEKNIEFVIPYGPGGGFDTLTRKMIPFMEEYFAKKGADISVVPVNMPGAGGAKAATYTTRAKPDGHTIQIFNIPGHGVSYITGSDGGFDITRMTWITQVGVDTYVLMTSASGPFKTLDNLINVNRDLKIPEIGPSATSSMANSIVWSTLNKGADFIYGYKSSQEYATAVLRGDGDLTMAVLGSAKRYNKAGDYNVIAHFSEQIDPEFPGALNGAAIGHPDLDAVNLLRVVAGPPGMSPEITNELHAALKYAVEHPELQKWAVETQNNAVSSATPAAADATVMRALNLYKQFSHLFK